MFAQENNELKKVMEYNKHYTDNESSEGRARELAKVENDQTVKNVEMTVFKKNRECIYVCLRQRFETIRT